MEGKRELHYPVPSSAIIAVEAVNRLVSKVREEDTRALNDPEYSKQLEPYIWKRLIHEVGSKLVSFLFEQSTNRGSCNPLNDGFLVTVWKDTQEELHGGYPYRDYVLGIDLWRVTTADDVGRLYYEKHELKQQVRWLKNELKRWQEEAVMLAKECETMSADIRRYQDVLVLAYKALTEGGMETEAKKAIRKALWQEEAE